MNQNELITLLREPFKANEIEWKLQVTMQDKLRGLAVPYIDSRAIQRRLDETVGIFDWRNEYTVWQEKAQICIISIFCEERGEWVSKSDGAPNSDFEAVKGGLSDSFKRAAVVWGIGRYLYELSGVWVDIEQKGKSYAIKDSQFSRLDNEYNTAVAKLFDTASPTQTGASDTSDNKQPPSQTTPPPVDSIYKVHSIKPSGKASQVLELIDNDGEITTAYVKNTDTSIKAGLCLRNVTIEQKNSSYGKYNLIANYELAA